MNAKPVQLTLLYDDLPHAREFAEWKATPGGRWILEKCYRKCAGYAYMYNRYGTGVSIKLIWELVRHDIKRLKARGVKLTRTQGYALNNNFHAHVVRHIASRRPEWAGMFSTREIGAPIKRSPVFIQVQRRHA